MRRFALCLALFAAGGCRAVLGIDPLPPGMAGSPSTEAPDACTPGSPGCAVECDADDDCDGRVCIEGGRCSACIPGEAQCEGATRRLVCDDDGAWQKDACVNQACVNGECRACSPGATVCTQDGTLRRCDDDGTWSDPSACEHGPCRDGACPARTLDCATGDRRCVEGTKKLEQCDAEGNWRSTECPYRCDAAAEGGASCGGECRPDAVECVGDSALRSCGNDARWDEPEPCEFGCQNGACNDCTPLRTECIDGNTRQRGCGMDGKWTAPIDCSFPCENDRCTACIPDQTQCASPNAQRTCDASGSWGNAEACALGCSGTKCATCMPGATECVNGGERVCGADGQWGPVMACQYGCSTTECNECLPSSTQCSNTMEQRSCSALGRLQAAVHCDLGCMNNVCMACSPGSAECMSGGRRVCGSTGQWGPTSNCANGCFAGECGSCSPGETRCTGGSQQTCNGMGQWNPGTPCAFGCAGNGTECAECPSGDIECPTSTTVRVCQGGSWVNAGNCRPNSTCSPSALEGGNTCPCDPGFFDPHPNPGLCMPL